ncbi:GNAT family N-acetyltransferase [Sulfuracidifex metallicus]|uniref:GNAT family N-acetyltransferase n=1 Tax=Sulfuracidifex metallicus TaxID=47303 RepID=UPI00227617CB|nr:GNAT family N-acetyltransferase [Sulfuracidifex metallicus]MCY0850274.1 GNAT family N-acetyltransferase [Sulfuracidifex metallicus]
MAKTFSGYERKLGVELKIRRASMSDLPHLTELYGSLNDDDLYMRFFIYHKVSEEEVKRILAQEDHVTLLAERDDKIIGEGSLFTNGEFSLVVRREHRRMGVGTKIVESLIEEAKARRIKMLIFYTLPNNYPMIAIGRKLGFTLKFDEDEVIGTKVML